MHSVETDKLVQESTPTLLLRLQNILTMLIDMRLAISGIPLAFSVSNMSIA